uniref:Uncharacterized protein n=1 Tax=Anguilla anguilla TaxID=7936 RepID=A0A0E9SFY4_ANGAN
MRIFCKGCTLSLLFLLFLLLHSSSDQRTSCL